MNPIQRALSPHELPSDGRHDAIVVGMGIASACMTSASSVHPSLTYMALTARACEFAVDLVKEGRL